MLVRISYFAHKKHIFDFLGLGVKRSNNYYLSILYVFATTALYSRQLPAFINIFSNGLKRIITTAYV